jgi:hypothetical protein
MNPLNDFKRLLVGCCGIWKILLCLQAVAADGSGIIDTPGVEGVHVEASSTNVTVTWPSDPRETFVVLWRSNADYRAQWIVLTNQMRAAANRNRTMFFDAVGLARPRGDAATTNLAGLYGVYVIPDFWFNMQGVTLCGGPRTTRREFLPFYHSMDGPGFPQPYVGLVVDGEEAGWGPERIERVNFGTEQNPHWLNATGFWLQLDLLPDGEHTLQLRSMLSLNNFVGDWTQDLFLTNKPVTVRILVNGEKSNFRSWSDQRLGHDFKAPQSAEEYERTSPKVKTPSRPFALFQMVR